MQLMELLWVFCNILHTSSPRMHRSRFCSHKVYLAIGELQIRMVLDYATLDNVRLLGPSR